MDPRFLRLLLILDVPILGGRAPVQVAREAIAGGVTAVQLRWKGGGDREVAALARALGAELTVPLFINDRLDIALATGAAGVHLGADDLPVPLARRIVPPGFLIGASVGDEREAVASHGADYVGVGPWRATTTKADAGAALGAEGVARLLATVKVPAVTIGGVRPEDLPAILATGAAGVAVASAIIGAPDVTKAARAFADRLTA